jgi:hypothetical protein
MNTVTDRILHQSIDHVMVYFLNIRFVSNSWISQIHCSSCSLAHHTKLQACNLIIEQISQSHDFPQDT